MAYQHRVVDSELVLNLSSWDDLKYNQTSILVSLLYLLKYLACWSLLWFIAFKDRVIDWFSPLADCTTCPILGKKVFKEEASKSYGQISPNSVSKICVVFSNNDLPPNSVLQARAFATLYIVLFCFGNLFDSFVEHFKGYSTGIF